MDYSDTCRSVYRSRNQWLHAGRWLRAARILILILRLADLSNARVLRAFVFSEWRGAMSERRKRKKVSLASGEVHLRALFFFRSDSLDTLAAIQPPHFP